jgi:hypothetical protein
MSENGLIIYTPDGGKHRASDEEQRKFNEWEKREEEAYIQQFYEDCRNAKATKKMLKGFKDKGFIQTRTRGTYAWKSHEEKAASLFRFASWIALTDKDGNVIPPALDWKQWDFEPIAPNEGTYWMLMPRLRWTGIEVYDVWVITKLKSGRKRRKLVKADFKSLCESRECERESCAYCWAGNNLTLREGEEIQIKRREGNPKVNDPAGVSPHGRQNSKAQDLGEDQRQLFALTSTQRFYKGETNEWK